jgi:Ca-activated chloride channel family protein
MAVFEVTLQKNINDTSGELARLILQYHLPLDTTLLYRKFPVKCIPQLFDTTHSEIKFATAVIMFGSLLKHSKYSTTYSYDDILSLLQQCANPDDHLQQDFIALIQKARKVYPYKRKRHWTNKMT